MIYGAKRLRWANATLADVFHKNNQPNTGSFGQAGKKRSVSAINQFIIIHLHLPSGHAAKQCDQKTYIFDWLLVMGIILPRIQALPSSTVGILINYTTSTMDFEHCVEIKARRAKSRCAAKMMLHLLSLRSCMLPGQVGTSL